jgi:hypothetical protein
MLYRYLSLKKVPLEELKAYLGELKDDIKARKNEALRVNREIKARLENGNNSN